MDDVTRQELEAQVRMERIKAQAARRDAEKIQKQAEAEKQSMLDVMNHLLAEQAALKQTAAIATDCQEKLREVTATLEAVRGSLSFRLGVTVGKPVVALLRLLRGRR